MKIAIVSPTGEAGAVLDHSDNCSEGVQNDSEAIFVDSPLCDVPSELPIANTSIGVKNVILNADLRHELLNRHLGITHLPMKSCLYALFNGKEFSDWMEICYTRRFMNSEIGPDVGFSSGVGMRIDQDVCNAVTNMSKLKEIVAALNYRGEVCCGLAEDGGITGVSFGHVWGMYGMFQELCQQSVDQDVDKTMEFIFGEELTCTLYDSICVSNIVSKHPFPLITNTHTGYLRTPKYSNNHVWRVGLGSTVEIVMLTSSGVSLKEARRRVHRSQNNMRKYDDFIQYRTDFGFSENFIIMRDKYEEMKKNHERR